MCNKGRYTGDRYRRSVHGAVPQLADYLSVIVLPVSDSVVQFRMTLIDPFVVFVAAIEVAFCGDVFCIELNRVRVFPIHPDIDNLLTSAGAEAIKQKTRYRVMISACHNT